MFDAGSVLGSLAGLPHFPMSFTEKIEHQLTTRQFDIYIYIIKTYDLIIYKKYYTTYTHTYIYIHTHPCTTLAIQNLRLARDGRGYCCLSLPTDLNELAHVFFPRWCQGAGSEDCHLGREERSEFRLVRGCSVLGSLGTWLARHGSRLRQQCLEVVFKMLESAPDAADSSDTTCRETHCETRRDMLWDMVVKCTKSKISGASLASWYLRMLEKWNKLTICSVLSVFFQWGCRWCLVSSRAGPAMIFFRQFSSIRFSGRTLHRMYIDMLHRC